jgi:hypothetical protein
MHNGKFYKNKIHSLAYTTWFRTIIQKIEIKNFWLIIEGWIDRWVDFGKSEQQEILFDIYCCLSFVDLKARLLQSNHILLE